MSSPPGTGSDVPAAASTTPPREPAATGSSAPSRWVDFLAGDVDALPLRLFEVLFTSTFLLWMGRCFMGWREWLTNEGFHLQASEAVALGYPAPFPLLSGAGVVCLAVVMGGAGLAHLLNRGRRIALAVLFAGAVYVQGVDMMAVFTLNKLYVGVYGILLLTPGYAKEHGTGRLRVSAVAIRLIQATLIVHYFAAGIAKVTRGEWLKYGDAVYTQVQGVYRTDAAAWLLRVLPVGAWTVLQGMVLLFELGAPLLFCWRKLRPVAFALGLACHLLVALLMKDLIFSGMQILSFYALFVTAEKWRTMGHALMRWTPWRRTKGHNAERSSA